MWCELLIDKCYPEEIESTADYMLPGTESMFSVGKHLLVISFLSGKWKKCVCYKRKPWKTKYYEEAIYSSSYFLSSLVSLLWFSLSKMTGRLHFCTVVSKMAALKFTAMFYRDIVWWQLSLIESFHCCFVILSYPVCKVYAFPYTPRQKTFQHLIRGR